MPRLWSLAALVLLAGCDTRAVLPGEPEPLCTEDFREFVVTVLAPGGAPATDMRTNSVVVTTGQTLLQSVGAEDGVYPVANDGHKDSFGSETRIVRFTASNADLFGMADFVFGYDGCHIVKVSGPTQFSVRFRGGTS